MLRKWPSATPNILSPIPNQFEKPKSNFLTNLFQKKKSSQKLEEIIKKSVGNEWRDYSVYVRDLNSDFEAGVGESVVYKAASVNKIPILAVLYYKHQSNEIDFDKNITLQEQDIQDYGTGSIRYDPPGTVYSLKTLARLMIEQSDNTAAYIIGNYVLGLDLIQSLLNQWGMTQTDMVNNKTSNKDMALLFEKIYSGKISNLSDTQEMLSFLENTDNDNRIPAQLPEGVVVYHKIGTENGQIHDAGIVKYKNILYYIGIFTNGVEEGTTTDKKISDVSKVVFDYMNN